MDMREQKFGIEIEMTGITRQRAAEVMAAYFSSVASYDGGSYEVYSVRDAAGRRWKVMYDSSIEAQKKGGGYAGSEYKVEFVSPICEYADIPVIQELIRQLRHAGAVAGKNTGIHVHINAAPHDARTLRNITNIMYSKEDLIYKALQVDVEREHRYCQKVEEDFLQELGMVRKLGREHADKNTHNNLYEHLKAVAVLGGADKIQETDVKQLSGKCALFLAKLTEYRDKSSVESLYDLCWEMIYDSGYYDYVGTMPAGAQRQANLNVLLEVGRR